MSQSVESDRDHDNDAGHDFLHPIGEADVRAARLDDGHERGADQRADDGSFAAEKRRAPDDGGRDHFELEADRVGRISDGQRGELHDAGEPRERGRQRVDADLHALDGDAAEARGALVRADREYVPVVRSDGRQRTSRVNRGVHSSPGG